MARTVAAGARTRELQTHVDAVNASLGHVEQVKRWRLLDADFRVGDELTPTLKVKRKVVAQKYADGTWNGREAAAQATAKSNCLATIAT